MVPLVRETGNGKSNLATPGVSIEAEGVSVQRSAKGLSRLNDNLSQMQELEGRRLMSGTVTLPFSLDFGATVTGTAVDKDGQGTGFNAAQTGQASQVDINTAKGTLALTADYSTGKPSASLETAFDGTTRG